MGFHTKTFSNPRYNEGEKLMFQKILLQLIAAIVCLLPTELFLLIKAALAPTGFIQTFLVYGLGIYVFGAIQLALLALLAALSFYIWTEY